MLTHLMCSLSPVVCIHVLPYYMLSLNIHTRITHSSPVVSSITRPGPGEDPVTEGSHPESGMEPDLVCPSGLAAIHHPLPL